MKKKRTAEAAILQEEVRVKAKGREIKHIMPSFGRMSIFEMMNQSVVSVINDFKKLNIDSSISDNIKDEIKTSSVNTKPNIIDENKANVNTKDSSIPVNNISENNDEKSKSVLIKGDNNELNKKRRIN